MFRIGRHQSPELAQQRAETPAAQTVFNMARYANPPTSHRLSPTFVFILALAALYYAKEILIPLSLAALIAFLLTPAVMRFEKWRVPRVVGVILVMVFSLSLVAGLGWIAVNQLVDVLNQLPNYKANIHAKFEALRGPGKGSFAKASESVKELGKELSGAEPEQAPPTPPARTSKTLKDAPLLPSLEHPVPVRVVESPPSALQSLGGVLGPLLAPIGTAVIVLVFSIIMLIKREDLRDRVIRLIGQTQLNLATEAFDDATTRISRYLRLQFLINATFGGLITVGLYFIGVPNALLWGVLAGVLRFLPYIGAIVGASVPLVLSLALFNSWHQPLMCLALFLIVEPTVAYLIEPALYGAHTGISSLAILVSAAVWTALWGPIGLLLSTPLTVCLVVMGRHVPQLKFLHILLGDEPVLTPAAQFYQRLLAMNQVEARVVIDAFLKDRPVIELYDEVVIPALSMAEEDRHKGALDDTRERFLVQSIEEFVAEHADDVEASPRRGVRVVCLAGSDKADEISAAMLGQVLEGLGYAAVSFPVLDSPAEFLNTLSCQPNDILCISAVPPFALMRARSLSKELRTRFPELRILLGLWGFATGGDKSDERLENAFAVEVVTTLAQAVERISPQPESPADQAGFRLPEDSPLPSPLSKS